MPRPPVFPQPVKYQWGLTSTAPQVSGGLSGFGGQSARTDQVAEGAHNDRAGFPSRSDVAGAGIVSGSGHNGVDAGNQGSGGTGMVAGSSARADGPVVHDIPGGKGGDSGDAEPCQVRSLPALPGNANDIDDANAVKGGNGSHFGTGSTGTNGSRIKGTSSNVTGIDEIEESHGTARAEGIDGNGGSGGAGSFGGSGSADRNVRHRHNRSVRFSCANCGNCGNCVAGDGSVGGNGAPEPKVLVVTVPNYQLNANGNGAYIGTAGLPPAGDPGAGTCAYSTGQGARGANGSAAQTIGARGIRSGRSGGVARFW